MMMMMMINQGRDGWIRFELVDDSLKKVLPGTCETWAFTFHRWSPSSTFLDCDLEHHECIPIASNSNAARIPREQWVWPTRLKKNPHILIRWVAQSQLKNLKSCPFLFSRTQLSACTIVARTAGYGQDFNTCAPSRTQMIPYGDVSKWHAFFPFWNHVIFLKRRAIFRHTHIFNYYITITCLRREERKPGKNQRRGRSETGAWKGQGREHRNAFLFLSQNLGWRSSTPGSGKIEQVCRMKEVLV